MSLRIACVRVPRPGTARPAAAEAATLAGALLAAAPRVTQGRATERVPAARYAPPPRGHRRKRGEGAVGDAETLWFWADASGMQGLGGDAAVAQALLASAQEAGFPEARVGVADTCIAAAVATHVQGTTWRVVAPGRDASFLSRRPLELLPLDVELGEALRLLGLRTCGELARLAAADVELRWGAAGLGAWRLARGEDARWPFRPPPPESAVAEAEWESPIEGLEPLRFVLRGLIASILAQLAGRQRVPAALRLTLRLEDAGSETREIRPARPTADERTLAELCGAELEALGRSGGLAAPITGLRLEAAEGIALADQLDAFRPANPDPAAVHAALRPLLERWGESALVRAVARGAHLPEACAEWETVGPEAIRELAQRRERPPRPAVHPSVTELPLCLRRFTAPRPVRVRLDHGSRPAGVWLDPGGSGSDLGQGWLAASSEGPERLSGSRGGRAYAREYWLLEEENGCLLLLYRDALSDGWWLEGWWD